MSGFQSGVMTRSRAAVSNRHPHAEQAFKEGLQSIFRQWTALELAIFHQWGGPTSAERVTQLVEEVFSMFQGPDKIYRDEVSLVLEDYMETNFNTLCDDGSPDEIGDLLVTMWRECCAGDFNLVSTVLGREFVRHETLSKCQGLASTGDVMDSDDEEGVVDAEGLSVVLEEATAEAEAEAEAEEEMEEEPAVDPDGWATVARGKSKSKPKPKKK